MEADLYCILGLAYATFVSLCSMAMFWWIDLNPGWEWLANASAISWIGFGMAALAWTKGWMNKPSFGTGLSRLLFLVDHCIDFQLACSMTVIVFFVV